jgi:hypothetical protein
MMVPGVDGTLNMRHPDACQAPLAAAARGGADNRRARRAWLGARQAARDPGVFPLLAGIFAGPETVPTELVDDGVLDRIRRA